MLASDIGPIIDRGLNDINKDNKIFKLAYYQY